MTFLNPWLLLALLPVAAVAALSLLRPRRAEVIVPTLQWWLAALEASGGAARTRTARLRLAWLVLLAGAAAGALALARPAGLRHASVRWVCLELLPAIETGGYGGYPSTLQPAVEQLLDRLDQADCVQVVLPEILGGARPWTSRDEAKRIVRQVEPLPVLASELARPALADGRAQLTCVLAPASAAIPPGPWRVAIALPSSVPPLTVQQFGAEIIDDETVAVFLAVRNNTDERFDAAVDAASGSAEPTRLMSKPLPPRQTMAATVNVPRSRAVSFTGRAGGREVLLCGMVERPARPIRVILRGEPSGVLKRYLAADAAVAVVDEPGSADLEICCGAGPSGDLPCLLIDPPRPAVGWQLAPVVENVLLGMDDLAGDDPLLEGVAAGTMAIRRARPWSPGDRAGGVVAAGRAGAAVIWRSAVDRQPRQVALNFALTAENTNISDAPAWVVLLANAVRWLIATPPTPARYEWAVPVEAIGWRDWTLVSAWPTASDVPADGPLPWPGIYRDRQGDSHVVNPPLGIRSAEPAVPPAEAIAAISLPAPAPAETAWEAWPVLAVLAGLCWIVGWAMTLQWR